MDWAAQCVQTFTVPRGTAEITEDFLSVTVVALNGPPLNFSSDIYEPICRLRLTIRRLSPSPIRPQCLLLI